MKHTYSVLILVFLILVFSLFASSGCNKKPSLSAHMSSVIGDVVYIDNSSLKIKSAQDINEIRKGEEILLVFEDEEDLAKGLEESSIKENSRIRVLYLDIDQEQDYKVINVLRFKSQIDTTIIKIWE